MMLGEQEPRLDAAARAQGFELPPEQELLEELLLDPERHGHRERGEPAGSEGEVRLEEPLELEERLVVEDDMVHLVEGEAALGEAILDGAPGKPRVVLPATEPLLLCRGHDSAVLHEGRGAVVVEGRDAEDAHGTSLP